jgi:hypothetical protein
MFSARRMIFYLNSSQPGSNALNPNSRKLTGKGVHRPTDSYSDQQEKDEGPEDVFRAVVGAATAEETKGDRDYQGENYHGLEMAEREFVYGHHRSCGRVMLCGLG